MQPVYPTPVHPYFQAWIVQQCLRLQSENQQLRLSLYEENPTK